MRRNALRLLRPTRADYRRAGNQAVHTFTINALQPRRNDLLVRDALLLRNVVSMVRQSHCHTPSQLLDLICGAMSYGYCALRGPRSGRVSIAFTQTGATSWPIPDRRAC